MYAYSFFFFLLCVIRERLMQKQQAYYPDIFHPETKLTLAAGVNTG